MSRLSRVFFLVDLVLVLAAAALGVHLHRVWTARTPTARGEPGVARTAAPVASSAGPRGARPIPAVAAAGPTPHPGLDAFAVVAERNLFSPARREAAAAPPTRRPAVPASPAAPRLHLYGIVLGADGGARAYLRNPRTGRLVGYGVGDVVTDRRIEEIRPDRVVLQQGSERVEIFLRDPTKPRAPRAVGPARVRRGQILLPSRPPPLWRPRSG